jgi:hypothetical protein
MERTDIFKQILEAEQMAKTHREEAVIRQEGLDHYLAEREALYRSESLAKADEEIEAEEKKLSADVEAEIRKLKTKQQRDVLNIHVSFDKKLEQWVDKLFEIVVGNA